MGICLLANGSVPLAAGRLEDNECPRVAAGWESPGKERDFPRQAHIMPAELGGCWEAGKGSVVLGVLAWWGLCGWGVLQRAAP